MERLPATILEDTTLALMTLAFSFLPPDFKSIATAPRPLTGGIYAVLLVLILRVPTLKLLVRV